jgi:hypothetical protein
VLFSCSSIKSEKKLIKEKDNDSTYMKYWKGIVLDTCIIGTYISWTPPLHCKISINNDTSGYLIYESKKYNLIYTDTFYLQIDSLNKSYIYNLDTGIYFNAFRTFNFKNGFILLVNNDDYLLFYKVIDSKGNYIKLPEFEDWFEFYLSYLLDGIEEKIIQENFGLKYSKLTRIKYELQDSIY